MGRIRLFQMGISLLYVFLIARLFQLTVVESSHYKDKAFRQHAFVLRIPPGRGSIVDTFGNPIVMSVPAYLVYAQPKLIQNPTVFSEKVGMILMTEPEYIFRRISDPSLYWVPLAHKVDPVMADMIRNLDMEGLGLEDESKRFYPESSMAAHLLGFVGYDEKGEEKGYFGLEGMYNRDLTGSEGYVSQEKDARGNPIVIAGMKRVPATNGRTLGLWLDRVVQEISESALTSGMKKYGAVEGSVVVMDPQSGGILAMASYPSYDPQTYTLFDQSLYKNPVVSAGYEPGSTFKVLVMAAGIDEGVVTPDSTFHESGPVRIGQYSIKTWDDTYRGMVTMREVLIHSSNVGMTFVAQRLGKDALLAHIRDMGFGDITGIDLEDETSPQIRPDDEWKDIDLATASFGQGIAVTPLQMVRAVSAIANGGNLLAPRVVKNFIEEDGSVKTIQPKVVRRVFSQSTANIVTEMMVEAVDKGESKWAKPKGYRIAGKTGTAQIPVAGHYDEKKTIASFIGFAPADNPKFVILVTLREPQSSPWGSETAAPLFFDIAKKLMLYYSIPPSG